MPLELIDDRPPVPPADLILRVAPFAPDRLTQAREAFDLDAIEHLRRFERALAGAGRSFSDFERMLDFGCGCGRFLRHLVQFSDHVEVHGTDIDAEMIAWVTENIPQGHYAVAPHEPPLPYPDHHFDLVINHSVFSHLDERLQDLWLGELQRITRPGAVLMLTVEGASSWNRTCAASERVGEDLERWSSELETRGILFISDDLYIGSTHPDFYHSTIHAPWYVFEHWSAFFDIAAYIPDGSISQDLVVLVRREDGAPRPRTIGHRAAAPAAAPAPEWPVPVNPPAPARAASRLAAVPGLAKRLAARAVAGAAARDARPATPAEPPTAPDEAVMRELNMLRVGLYEQGDRISVLAAQLREEIEAAPRGGERLGVGPETGRAD